MPKRSSKSNPASTNSLLIEVAWEVCNPAGGIYTVIRSKAQAMGENLSAKQFAVSYVNFYNKIAEDGLCSAPMRKIILLPSIGKM